MGTEGILTPIAAAIIRQLQEHPGGRTAYELARDGRHEGVHDGLAELEAKGLARRDGDGRWSLLRPR
jgi:DNA-binding IclR family transcriptional regulator